MSISRPTGPPGALGLCELLRLEPLRRPTDDRPGLEAVVAVALEVELVDDVPGLHVEAPAAPLAGQHEELEALGDVVPVAGRELEPVGHGDGLFRAEFGAAPAIHP